MASVISAGTTSGTALNFSGDTSGVLQLASNGTTTALSISTAQVVTLTNALAVTSGGTGVTTSTGTGANVLGTSPTITTPTISSLSSASATALTLQSAGTTAVTIDTSQNVGIGTASPGAKLDVSSTASRIFNLNSTSANGYGMAFNNSGTDVAYIGSAKWTFSGALNDMSITTHGAYNLCFGTNDTERMRIDSSGNLLVGTTSQLGAGRFCLVNDASHNGIVSKDSGSNNYIYVGTNSSNSTVFAVLSSGNVQNTNNSYGALSDVKLKENIIDATPKLDALMQVKVRNYNLKSDPTHKQLGVIAQELETVFPAMVEETLDKDAEGNSLGTKTKAVKYSVFVPMLIKAMQELKAINDTQAETINAQSATLVALTARVTALEGA